MDINFIIVIIALAVLGLLVRYRMQQPELAYDTRATSLVTYADMRAYPGAPPPDNACLGHKFTIQQQLCHLHNQAFRLYKMKPGLSVGQA